MSFVFHPAAPQARTTFWLKCSATALFLASAALAQDQPSKPSATQTPTPTQQPAETPKTAPQVKKVLPSYEGQTVSALEIAGRPDVKTEDYIRYFALKPGEPFSQEKVQQSMDALKRDSRFHDVQLEIRPDAKGVRVLFVLQPALYFGIFQFPGASRFNYSRLLQATNYPPRGEYSHLDVQDAVQDLTRFLKRNGYFLAKVDPEVQTDEAHGLANIIFHVTLNKKAKFGEVEIEGASPEEAAHLKSVSHSFMARIRGSAIRPGKTYRMKTVGNASQYLEGNLMKQHHLAAEVKLLGAQYKPETNRADIHFHVNEGPVVNVKVAGAHVWGFTQKKILPVYQQVGINTEIIQEGRQNLISHFQGKGFFDAKVDVNVQKPDANSETIVYQVTKGPRHKVTGVEVAGNQKMDDDDLLPHVAVKKAHWFNHGTYSEKVVKQSVKNLKAVYQASGFSSVKVTPTIETAANGNITAKFTVDEGPQDIVDSLKVEGNDTVPVSQLTEHGLHVVPGQPYSQKLVNDDRKEILAQYLKNGYLIATMRQTARDIPGQPHHIAVAYTISEGPKVHTATRVTLGKNVTRQTLVNKDVNNIQPGEPLTEDEMLIAETQLYDRGIYDWAEVDPRRQITTQNEEDVIVKVHEAKRNSLTYGFGFEVTNRGGSIPSGTVAVPGLPPVGLPSGFTTNQQTFYGPRATLEYTRINLRGRAESFTFSGLGSRLDQRGSLIYTAPELPWANWESNATISGEYNQENPIFSSRQAQAGLQLQHPFNKAKTKNLFIRYNFRETGLTRLEIPDLIPLQDRHVRLSTISGSYINDTRDNSLDAHKGMYQSLELDLNPSALGSNVDFVKFLGQAAYYKQIPAKIIWANSLRLGLEQPFNGSHVPLSETFFSGGGSTLRGFSLNGAGPQRTVPICNNPADTSTCTLIKVPVGGNELVILNSELRIPLDSVKKNLGFVVFYDGGNVFDRIGFHNFTQLYTNTVGIGARYATPVGPIRIDIGHNMNAPAGLKATQIFITLGQAF
jgi:outer membrane protein insertion porin family